MSIFRFLSNDLGTGTITVASPITNANNTLTLPDVTGNLIATDAAGNVIVTGTLTTAGISDSGNLAFTGTGNRITGDMSNATVASRLMFQTNTTNSNTVIGAIPNGSGVASVVQLYSNVDTANSSLFQLTASTGSSQISLISGITGTGTYLPMTFYTGGSERMRLDTSGNFGIGTNSPTSFVNSGSGFAVVGTNAQTQVYLGSSTSGISIGGYTGAVYVQSNSTNALISGTVGAAEFVFRTNATERMRIASDGNVGIGTSAPTYKLQIANINAPALGVYRDVDVTSVGTAGQSIEIGARSGATFTPGASLVGYLDNPATTGGMQFYTRSSNVLTERMRIDSTGNVGIGTTSSPTFRLTVNAGSSVTVTSAQFYTSDGTYNTALQIQHSTAGIKLFNSNSYTGTANNLIFGNTSVAETMRIQYNGYVGIGNPSPEAKLTVSGTGLAGQSPTNISQLADGIRINGGIANTSYTGIGYQSGGGGGAAVVFSRGGGYDTYLQFFTNSALVTGGLVERMRINHVGNVGIGTTNPVVALDVYSTDVSYSTPMRAATSAAGGWAYGPGTSYNVFYVLSDAPGGHGVYLANGTDAWTPHASDARLKNKISGIENALEAILKLEPLKYYFKNAEQSGTPRYGFFAQNVGEAIPDAMLVAPIPDHELGEIYTYAPDIINTHLVKAVQEQQVLIDDLTKRLEIIPKLDIASEDQSLINHFMAHLDKQQSLIDKLNERISILESQVNQT